MVKATDIRLTLLATPNPRIRHPLHKHVTRLLPQPLRSSIQFDSLSATAVDGLNMLIARSTILWEFYGVSAVLGLSRDVAVKIGSHIDYDHISTLEYINKHAPDIPTPAIYGVLRTDNRTYLFMQRIKGGPLDALWPGLDEAQKISIRHQLTPMFKCLRAIPRPPLEDGKFTLGGGNPRRCKDQRRNLLIATYPIASEEEFNTFLFNTGGQKTMTQRAKMLRSFLRSDHRIVMTHSDLHPRNIMVVMEPAETNTFRIRVVAIIDWEFSGWYPEYWEYTKALHTVVPGSALEDWWAYVPVGAIGKWPGDFAIDMMITSYLDA